MIAEGWDSRGSKSAGVKSRPLLARWLKGGGKKWTYVNGTTMYNVFMSNLRCVRRTERTGESEPDRRKYCTIDGAVQRLKSMDQLALYDWLKSLSVQIEETIGCRLDRPQSEQ